jgi:surface protein
MSLQNFVSERLKITSNTKSATIRPNTRKELRVLIEQELERQGPDADLNFIDTSEITDMSYLFENLTIRNIKINKWNTFKVTNMHGTFLHCSEFVGSGFETWDISNVTNMVSMFAGCKKLNPDLSEWDVTNVTDMISMFSGCKKFEGTGLENWNVSNVAWMSTMFVHCSDFNADISRWNTSKVRDMTSMFRGCTSLEQDLSGWDIQKAAAYRKWMFKDCPKMKMKMKPTVKK